MKHYKKLVITCCLFIFGFIAQAQVVKTQVKESSIEDYIILLKQKGYQSFSVDITSLQNETYVIEPIIKHFQKGKEVELAFSLGIAFTNRDDLTLSDNVKVGFSPTDNPNVRMLSFHVTETGAMTMPLLFDERKNPETGEPDDSYGYRRFEIDGIEIGKFTPIALCGAYWYDTEDESFRFCGEYVLDPDLNDDILKSVEDYYIIGMIVTKQ